MKKRPYISHTLEVRYRDDVIGASSIEAHLAAVFSLLKAAVSADPLLAPPQWLIATGEKDSSYLYQAFDAQGPTAAALAFIREDNKGDDASQSFVLWNGEEDRTKGASISCRCSRRDGRSSNMTFAMRSEADRFRLEDTPNAINLVAEATRIYKPIYCSLSPDQYVSIFPDRPEVGWMIYLPRMLTVQQVPEARASVPVIEKDAKGKDRQTGTIIVSVVDAPFSDENPEHVTIANAIEIRLVDQDLLPRFADL